MSDQTLDKAMEKVIDIIDKVTDPEHMSKKEYAAFLDTLIGDLCIRKEAVDQELKEQEDDG
jgi:hypothetical protein